MCAGSGTACGDPCCCGMYSLGRGSVRGVPSPVRYGCLLAAAACGVSNSSSSSSLSSSNKSWNVFRCTGPGVVFVVLLVPFRFPILFVFLLYYWWYYYYWY